MAQGRKTGGRRRGTPNKRTVAARAGLDELLDRYQYDPLEELLKLAGEATFPSDRLQIALALMPYRYPRMRPVELDELQDTSVRVVFEDVPKS